MKVYIIIIFLFCFIEAIGQNFSGTITYKIELFSSGLETKQDSLKWDVQKKFMFGDKGFIVQKYFFTNNRYESDIIVNDQTSKQLYIAEEKILYSWFEGSKTCNSLMLKFQSEKTLKIWYNKEYFKVNSDLLESHYFNNLSEIIKTIDCFPFSIEELSDDTIAYQTIISYEKQTPDHIKFELPEFEKIVVDGEGW